MTLGKESSKYKAPTLVLTPHKPSFCAHACLTFLSSASCIPVFVDVETIPRSADRAVAQRAAYNI